MNYKKYMQENKSCTALFSLDIKTSKKKKTIYIIVQPGGQSSSEPAACWPSESLLQLPFFQSCTQTRQHGCSRGPLLRRGRPSNEKTEDRRRGNGNGENQKNRTVNSVQSERLFRVSACCCSLAPRVAARRPVC